MTQLFSDINRRSKCWKSVFFEICFKNLWNLLKNCYWKLFRERIQFSRKQIGERQKFNEKQRLEMEEFQREAQIQQVQALKFCVLLLLEWSGTGTGTGTQVLYTHWNNQDEIELELAAREKEVDESEQNIKNYEQTLIVRYDMMIWWYDDDPTVRCWEPSKNIWQSTHSSRRSQRRWNSHRKWSGCLRHFFETFSWCLTLFEFLGGWDIFWVIETLLETFFRVFETLFETRF